MKFVFAICFSMATAFTTTVLADVATGQSTYAARGCIGCHGAGGVSVVTTYPSFERDESRICAQKPDRFPQRRA